MFCELEGMAYLILLLDYLWSGRWFTYRKCWFSTPQRWRALYANKVATQFTSVYNCASNPQKRGRKVGNREVWRNSHPTNILLSHTFRHLFEGWYTLMRPSFVGYIIVTSQNKNPRSHFPVEHRSKWSKPAQGVFKSNQLIGLDRWPDIFRKVQPLTSSRIKPVFSERLVFSRGAYFTLIGSTKIIESAKLDDFWSRKSYTPMIFSHSFPRVFPEFLVGISTGGFFHLLFRWFTDHHLGTSGFDRWNIQKKWGWWLGGYSYWLVVGEKPLWKIWLRQLGWWKQPNINGKNAKNGNQTTNQAIFLGGNHRKIRLLMMLMAGCI